MEQESIRLQLVARPYKLEDYPLIVDMWERQRATPPPIDVLGKNGVIVEHKGEVVCAIFIFQPASSMGMIEFQVCNPVIRKDIRNEAVDLMLEKAIEICRKIGYKYIYTATDSTKFKNRLEGNGFVSKGGLHHHMFWGL